MDRRKVQRRLEERLKAEQSALCILVLPGRFREFSYVTAENFCTTLSNACKVSVLLTGNEVSNHAPPESFITCNSELMPIKLMSNVSVYPELTQVENFDKRNGEWSKMGVGNQRRIAVVEWRGRPDKDRMFPKLTVSEVRFEEDQPGYDSEGDKFTRCPVIYIRALAVYVAKLIAFLRENNLRRHKLLREPRSPRWKCVMVAYEKEQDISCLKALDFIYVASHSELFEQKDPEREIIIKCSGRATYPNMRTPQALRVLSMCRDPDQNILDRVFPHSDFFISVSVKKKEDIEVVMEYLREANAVIEPPMFHSTWHQGKTQVLGNVVQRVESSSHWVMLAGLSLFTDENDVTQKVKNLGCEVTECFGPKIQPIGMS